MRERIDGIPYHMESLSDDEIVALKGYALNQIERHIADVERLTAEQFRRSNDQLPLDSDSNREHLIGRLLMAHEITAEQAFEAVNGTTTT